MKRDKGTVVRILASVVLAVAAAFLFTLNRERDLDTPEAIEPDVILAAQQIDREIDRILVNFGVEKAWVRKKEIESGKDQFARIERRVIIPPTIVPVLVNREFNMLARRHQGRAVATENLRENIVTIHILLRRIVVQTVILKVSHDIRDKGPKVPPHGETGEQAKKI